MRKPKYIQIFTFCYSDYNWLLDRNGPAGIPVNVDENYQVPDPPPTTRRPVPLGKPAECPPRFPDIESHCSVVTIIFLQSLIQ